MPTSRPVPRLTTPRFPRPAVYAIAVLSLACSAAGAQSAGTSSAIDAFRERLRDDVAADSAGGITAAVVIGDRMVWAEGFGWADRDRRIPAGVETIYRIGSISKTFTAVVLAQLVDRGVVRLDDPVDRYLPEVRAFADARSGASPITFRHLASHTAGLIREPRLQGAASGPIGEWEAKVLASIPTTSFDTVPGVRYAYSNIGYGVMGLALSRAAKTPFMQLVEEGIFAPLSMTRSTFVIQPALRPLLSVGYVNGRATLDTVGPSREHLGRGYKVPNGGIYSTVGDLARFIAFFTGRGASATSDSIRLVMQSKQTPEPRPGGYGLGLQIAAGAEGQPTVLGHGGSVAGYTAHFAFDAESGVGVILLRNYQQGRTNLQQAATQLVRTISAEMARSPIGPERR